MKRKCQQVLNPKFIPTRREFLKEAGLLACGATLSPALMSSCQQEPVTGTENTPTQTTTEFSGTYVPSTNPPPLLSVPGCTFKVAADRRYTLEHLWVLPTSQNTAAMGITEKLVALLEGPFAIELPVEGESFTRGDAFGFIEGFKLYVDLVCPVSGKIVSMNKEIIEQQKPFSDQDAQGERIPAFDDPYNRGWLVEILLSNPQELNSLLTVDEYIAVSAKTVTATSS